MILIVSVQINPLNLVVIPVKKMINHINGVNKRKKKNQKKIQLKKKNQILVYPVLYLKIQTLIKVLLLNIVNLLKQENQKDDGVFMFLKENK
jgi:hypothetical protein